MQSHTFLSLPLTRCRELGAYNFPMAAEAWADTANETFRDQSRRRHADRSLRKAKLRFHAAMGHARITTELLVNLFCRRRERDS